MPLRLLRRQCGHARWPSRQPQVVHSTRLARPAFGPRIELWRSSVENPAKRGKEGRARRSRRRQQRHADAETRCRQRAGEAHPAHVALLWLLSRVPYPHDERAQPWRTNTRVLSASAALSADLGHPIRSGGEPRPGGQASAQRQMPGSDPKRASACVQSKASAFRNAWKYPTD
jgi:hypothetical protein